MSDVATAPFAPSAVARQTMSRLRPLLTRRCAAGVLIAALMAAGAWETAAAQSPTQLRGGQPNKAGEIAKPLRYRPEGGDFVILNGSERFNRALYGGNTAFRVEAGDKPEFVLYLPGRGGNLRLAVEHGGKIWWLADAARIEARYRPGEMLYEIADPRLGAGKIEIEAVADFATEGLFVRASAKGISGARLVWAYGGVSGERGGRDGDIGTERKPLSEWFQPQPQFADGNRIALSQDRFMLTSKAATITGGVVGGSIGGLAEAKDWDDPAKLLAAKGGGDQPLVTGVMNLTPAPSILSLQVLWRPSFDPTDLAGYQKLVVTPHLPEPAPKLPPAYSHAELGARFLQARAEAERRRNRLQILTPDPYLDAAVGALNIGSDATWDDPRQAIMHGAVAWRNKLIGWRGLYALDAIGWHDRATANFRGWFATQNTSPIPAEIAPPDEDSNLARSEAAVQSNGDMAHSHYDMNSVFIDGLFRHLNWTGDMELAQEAWPVIERHLAWQKRLFRRTYDDTGLPLYDSYAQIWASDDIHYNGGGTPYGSSYNVYANRQAARLARLLGKDPAPYEAEAAAIEAGMRRFLWNPERGDFAEYKDLLGRRMIHPSAGLWSYYHTIDSEVPTASEAWSMTASMLRNLPKIPIEGPGVPTDQPYGVYATTDWMPYTWSVNNVALNENAHAALALWQAGRPVEGYRLVKSSVLASMYMGIAPGNVGTLNYLDVYRREAQRDFADGTGTLSRAVVEGLFGLRPDALDGRISIAPGLPDAWDHAEIRQVDVGLAYKRKGAGETWTMTQPAGRFRTVHWRLPVRQERLVSATLNGKPVKWTADPKAVGRPVIVVEAPAGARNVLSLKWAGPAIVAEEGQGVLIERRQGAFAWQAPDGPALVQPAPYVLADQTPPAGAQETIDLGGFANDRIDQIFAKNKYRAPRAKASLGIPSQGIGAWAGHVNAKAEIDDRGVREAAAKAGGVFTLPDGGRFALSGSNDALKAVFVSQWSNYPSEAVIPASGKARYLRLLLVGTTNAMQSRIDNGEVIVTYTDGSTSRLPLINPTSWWPVQEDYLIDDYQFRSPGPRPLRVDLKTGVVRSPEARGGKISGGAATVLGLPLDPSKTLQAITIRALAQDVVIGAAGATLVR